MSVVELHPGYTEGIGHGINQDGMASPIGAIRWCQVATYIILLFYYHIYPSSTADGYFWGLRLYSVHLPSESSHNIYKWRTTATQHSANEIMSLEALRSLKMWFLRLTRTNMIFVRKHWFDSYMVTWKYMILLVGVVWRIAIPTPPPPFTFYIVKQALLAQEWNSFHQPLNPKP